MLKIFGKDGQPSQLDRALRYTRRFGDPSNEGKPKLPGERAARILDAQNDEPTGVLGVNVTQNMETGAGSLLIESRKVK